MSLLCRVSYARRADQRHYIRRDRPAAGWQAPARLGIRTAGAAVCSGLGRGQWRSRPQSARSIGDNLPAGARRWDRAGTARDSDRKSAWKHLGLSTLSALWQSHGGAQRGVKSRIPQPTLTIADGIRTVDENA